MKKTLLFSILFLSNVSLAKRLDRKLINKLYLLEKVTNCKFKITSGWRSKKKNKQVGGVPHSFHLIGEAIDIVKSGKSCTMSLEQIGGIATLLYDGVIVYRDGHIHLDLGKRKFTNVWSGIIGGFNE